MSSGNVSAEQLRLLIERVERLMEEKAGIADDIKDVFAEAKGQGYEVKTMRQCIKLRAMERDSRLEQEALLDTYKAALGMLDGTPLGDAAVRRVAAEPRVRAAAASLINTVEKFGGSMTISAGGKSVTIGKRKCFAEEVGDELEKAVAGVPGAKVERNARVGGAP